MPQTEKRSAWLFDPLTPKQNRPATQHVRTQQVQATRHRLFNRAQTYLLTPMAHWAGASNCIVGALGSHPFTSQKNMLCLTTRAPTIVDNLAYTVRARLTVDTTQKVLIPTACIQANSR